MSRAKQYDLSKVTDAQVRQWQKLVWYLCRRYSRHSYFDDLCQTVRIAIARALADYEPKRHAKIDTWVNTRARYAVLEFFRAGQIEIIPRSRHAYDAGLPVCAVLSLEDRVKSHRRTGGIPLTVQDVIPDSWTPEVSDSHIMLSSAIQELPERERYILRDYYWAGRELKAIGRDMRISESRVAQLRNRACCKLRKMLAE